jgi:antimicrobial peptide system SdpB family protein
VRRAPWWFTPWSNVYGTARTLVALGTLVSLAFNSPEAMFYPLGPEYAGMYPQHPWLRYSLFDLFPPESVHLAQYVAIGVLLLVASGWRPRLTAIPHWYVSASFMASTAAPEGGDQLAVVLTMLMIPVALADSRVWHWDRAPRRRPTRTALGVAIIASSALVMAKIQVCIVYLQAGVSKLGVTEWADGTAAYYWVTHPVFGVMEPLHEAASDLLSRPGVVMLATWGPIGFEVLLAFALLMPSAWRTRFLWAGIGFHLMIVLAHGLVAFFFAMAGALVLFLRLPNEPLGLPPYFPRYRAGGALVDVRSLRLVRWRQGGVAALRTATDSRYMAND